MPVDRSYVEWLLSCGMDQETIDKVSGSAVILGYFLSTYI